MTVRQQGVQGVRQTNQHVLFTGKYRCKNTMSKEIGVGVAIPQLTRNVFGTFAFGCMKVWVNFTFLECYTNVRLWLYERLAEPNV